MVFFYHASIRVDGYLWFHYRSQPSGDVYVAQPNYIFHNYGFTLAFNGFITDPDAGYASILNHTMYKKPSELFSRYGVYVYPPITTKALLREYTRAAQGEGNVSIRGRTRMAYPFFTKVVVYNPGSELEAFVISKEKLPSKFTLNVGAKRNGTLNVKLKPILNINVVENAETNYPFNIADSVRVVNHMVVLPHAAGDIAFHGIADRAYVYTIEERGRKTIIKAPVINVL